MSEEQQALEAAALREYHKETWAPYLEKLAATSLSEAEKELVAEACADLEIESRFDPSLLELIARLATPPALYAYYPGGHGSLTFAVVANSAPEAEALIDTHIRANHLDSRGHLAYEAQGWGTDYYELEVFAVGAIFTNENQ